MNEIPSVDPDRTWFETLLIDPQRGETRSIENRGNRVSFGLPATYDLVPLLVETGAPLPFEIRLQLDRYDFWLMRLVCTLHAAPRSTIRWLEVHVRLDEELVGASPRTRTGEIAVLDPADPPLVFDLSPAVVDDPVAVERQASISPGLEFQGTSVSLGTASLVLKYQRLEPRITAYGKRESTAYWRYTPGAGNKVNEGIKEMDLIVRRHKGRPVRTTVTVKGEGQQWGIFPSRLTLEDQQFSF